MHIYSRSVPSKYHSQVALGTLENPANSCKQIAELYPGSLPGHFWLRNSSSNKFSELMYCVARTQCCNNPGGWMRVAYLDMTDPHETCPYNFRQISSPKRLCGRKLNRGGCSSVAYSTQGFSYRRVCGRLIGYHFGTPSGFYTGSNSINDPYLEGVSITHGNPRKHIWSFANALQESGDSYTGHICPCTNPRSTQQQHIPGFVGNDYFCDSGSQGTGNVGQLYTDDPLWDGQGCELQSTCCTFNNPPWFCKELPQVTNDAIEVRICADQEPYHDEDSPIELIELYVQ